MRRSLSKIGEVLRKSARSELCEMSSACGKSAARTLSLSYTGTRCSTGARSAATSLNLPSGKIFVISSSMNFVIPAASFFRPIGQGESTSTNESPLHSIVFFIALRIAARAFMISFGAPSETRSTYTGLGCEATISAMRNGMPSSTASRPFGVVEVRWPTSVVGAICPPVMP